MNSLITGSVKYYSQTQNKQYIDILRQNPPFTKEEEKEMFTKLANGDESVVNEIAKRNQRWVYSMAKEYARDENEVMDYVQEGNIGLLEAIYTFNVNLGYKFITHAVLLLMQKMNAFMNGDRDLITKSNNAKLCKKIERVKNKFYAENGYMPYYDQIVDGLMDMYGIDVKNIADVYDLELLSMSDGVGDASTVEDSNEFTEATAVESAVDEKEDREYYRELVMPYINCLPEKEQQEFIKKLYHIGYSEDYTVAKLCEEYGKDEAWVRKMGDDILMYMRQKMGVQKTRIAV